jgi:hypothetical protein
MYILELIGRMLINLAKDIWLLPHTLALARQKKRRELTGRVSETERLDRLRNPAKYAGR